MPVLRSRRLPFQHTAARRRLHHIFRADGFDIEFQHTAARRRLVHRRAGLYISNVSTHSRPKAAASNTVMTCLNGTFQHTAARRRLERVQRSMLNRSRFQHTAARRRLNKSKRAVSRPSVSTHSRPKAADRQPARPINR